MFTEDKGFILRFSLEAVFPEDYEGESDQYQWLREWNSAIKPEVVRTVFATLRRYPGWAARVRNRGASEQDEIEIVFSRTFDQEAGGAGSDP